MAARERAPAGWFRSLRRYQLIVDIAVGLLLLAAGFAAATAASGADVAVLLILSAALALRRLSPGLALAVAWVGAIVQLLALRDVSPADLAILGVLYTTACYGERLVRWLGLVSAGVGAVLATAYLVFILPALAPADRATVDTSGAPGRALILCLFIGVAMLAVLGLSWTLGLLARTARIGRETRIDARIAAERADYEVAVEQERTRIARDMHDVVAHSLAVVIAQADGARYAASTDPRLAPAALETIAGTARTALADVRQLLAELRKDGLDGPQPTFADIDRLLAQMQETGLVVRVSRSGEPMPLSAGSEIAAYRIVQEALTNALRHGDTAEPVEVEFAWLADALRIRAVNGGAATEPSGGHGLPGMRERAALAGGILTAGRDEHGRFVVDATLPALGERGE
ncbi:histidine kinase [Rathayibacter sp. YIM 133350]|uniref:sensor histidine kinase n=1 Tax=Rathayibacter sp. YIM 133350 TaxID=3131992 RepID=UPI00307CE160